MIILRQVLHKISVGLLLVLFSIPCFSQSFLKNNFNDRYFMLSAGVGQNGYFGELNYNKNIRRGFRTYSLGLEARLLNRISARSELTYYIISGADQFAPDSTFEKQRNLSFQSKNLELNVQGMFYFNKYAGSYHKRRAWDPFVALGVGVTKFNPTTELGGEKFKLREFQTEGRKYGKYALVLPASIGAKGRLKKFISLVAEVGYRYTFTDYLDDVSTRYAGPFGDATRDALANRKDEIPVINEEAYELLIPGGKRGNSETKDSYLFVMLKLEIYLPPTFLLGQD